MSKETNQRQLEAATLRWIARLPLLRADDVPLLTGAHEADTRRALAALVRFGWIERVRARSPEFDEGLVRYVLRAVAVPHFIGALQLEEEEAHRGWPIGWSENLAHVTHLEITDYVNGLLVSLVETCRGTLTEVVDVRALPHSRRNAGSPWPQQVEGYGCLRHRDGFSHFFVAWDRAAAPAIHRQARVRAWYDAAQTRDYWGEGRLPPILLACSSRRVEAEWQDAVAAVARRRDRDQIDVFVTEPGHAFGNVTGATWRRLGEGEVAPLGTWLSWSSTPPPFEASRPVRYDLLARGVDVQAPTLHEWARRLLQERAAGPRDRIAALALQLEAHHKDVLDLLGRHPYLAADEIAERLRVPQLLVDRVIRDLLQHGLIAGAEEPAPAR